MTVPTEPIRVLPDFGSGSGKSGIRPFFGNPAKSGFGQISSQICRMPCVQLQYVHDKTIATDPSSGVFTILIIVTWIKNN